MISIIAPTYNRFEIVEETILKIISIDLEFELIIVNDGEKLPFSISHPKLKILENPKRGAASARNFGASHAKYDILFFIDDDMWITAESLQAIEKLRQQQFFITNCTILNWRYPDYLLTKMKNEKIGRYLLNSNYHNLEGRLKQKINKNEIFMRITSIGSGSFAISKETLEMVGKYNDNITFQGEDIEISSNLNKHLIPILLYIPITCFHNQKDRLDIKGYLDREQRGYFSQFQNNNLSFKPNKIKQIIFSFLIPFNTLFLLLFNILPNKPQYDRIIFRTIGTLTSIAYFKAWYKAKNLPSTFF